MKSSFYLKYILLICFSAFICLSVNAQVHSILKKTGKHFVSDFSEITIKKNVSKRGSNYLQKEIIEHSLKKKIRKKFIQKIEKEGFDNLFSYSNKHVFIELGPTATSNVASKYSRSLYSTKITQQSSNLMGVTSPIHKFRSKYLQSKLSKTVIKKDLDEILARGPISLSPKELDELLNHPDYLREIMMVKTGSQVKGMGNFQEFFIRLAQGNPEQVKKILETPQIREKVNRAIRQGGGKHEWLMTKNFEDFLLDPKWGNDGPFLALALTKLVQKTEKVIFKYGGSHLSRENSGKFHLGLAKVIAQSSSKEELFLAIKKYAKDNLTKESYDDFIKVFVETFDANKYLI